MKLTHLAIGAALVGGAFLGAVACFLFLESRTPARLDSRREIVRQVADSLESMSKEGKDLPVPDPARLRANQGAGDAPAESSTKLGWSECAVKNGFVDYEGEIQSFGDSSASSVSLQRLIVLNHVGSVAFFGAASDFSSEAFKELHARPEESIQSIAKLLDAFPTERTEERSYLLQVATALDDPSGATHADVMAILRDEVAMGTAEDASPQARSNAMVAAAGLSHMGDTSPDILKLAKGSSVSPQEAGREPAAGAPAAGLPVSGETHY